jgi:hypothetical protein
MWIPFWLCSGSMKSVPRVAYVAVQMCDGSDAIVDGLDAAGLR